MLTDSLAEIAELIDEKLSQLLPLGEEKIAHAMRYSCLAEGKKLRPFLLVITADLFSVDRENSLRAASAIEITHTYSLIHDDLPAMDNDDYRRGKPSCHKQFGEATAILAGDSLLTLAFEILSDEKTHKDPDIRCQLIKILAQDIGFAGMAGGQMRDLLYEREITPNFEQIKEMHWMKTARLFVSCCRIGAKLGKALDKDELLLSEFARSYGLAFQYVDDLEDVLDKKILSNNNIVKVIGEEKTKKEAKFLIEESIANLDHFGKSANLLKLLAQNLLEKL